MAKPCKPDHDPDELIELTRAILSTLRQILAAIRELHLPNNDQLNNIMTKLSELAGTLTAVNTRLEEAQTEILEALKNIGNTDPDISPEGQAQLDKLAAIANALADIVQGTPPTPTS